MPFNCMPVLWYRQIRHFLHLSLSLHTYFLTLIFIDLSFTLLWYSPISHLPFICSHFLLSRYLTCCPLIAAYLLPQTLTCNTPFFHLPSHWDQVFRVPLNLHLLLLVHSDILICWCTFAFSWSGLISISLPLKTFPCTIIHLFSHPHSHERFYHCVLSCIFIASPSPLPMHWCSHWHRSWLWVGLLALSHCVPYIAHCSAASVRLYITIFIHLNNLTFHRYWLILQTNESHLNYFSSFFEKGNLRRTRSRLSCSKPCSSVIPVVS